MIPARPACYTLVGAASCNSGVGYTGAFSLLVAVDYLPRWLGTGEIDNQPREKVIVSKHTRTAVIVSKLSTRQDKTISSPIAVVPVGRSLELHILLALGPAVRMA